MSDGYSHRILDHLKHRRYQPRQARELAEDLGVPAKEREAFAQAVRALVDDGQVVLGSTGTVVLPPPSREVTGTFRRHERGFGFLIPDGPVHHVDLFVPAEKTGDALTGDRVRARVIHIPGRDRGGRDGGRSPYIGQVVEILQRADKHFVGNLFQKGRGWFVEIDGHVLSEPVVVRDPQAKNARAGDKVVVELIKYPSAEATGEGVILEVLGASGQVPVETQAVIRAYGLATTFPDEVMAEALQRGKEFDDRSVPAEREDLTGTFIATIDPPDAKDYDDAISIKRLDPKTQKDGAAYELGVHIADVSHFVRLGSKLDEEARARGNSTYLPRKVLPMLPEVLSNGVCSLQEGVLRYCKSAFIRYDAGGKPLSQRVANTAIRSAKRLTYLEAQALIDGDETLARQHAANETPYPPQLVAQLRLMDELAKVLRQRRLKEGMIVLALPQVELVHDDEGRVVDAVPEDDAFTHKLIEMFMVEANEAVARLFDRLSVPLLRRIHPDPGSYELGDLRQFARVAGYNIPMRPTRKELQALLDAVRGKPAQYAVHVAVLKALSRAEYSPRLVGHFALASDHYAHFTSPIRRYPDLLVHRAIDAFLQHAGQKGSVKGTKGLGRLTRAMLNDPRCPDEPSLMEAGRHCSATERTSEAAEDDLRSYLVMELLSKHVGEEFQATVSGVTANGVFVQLDRFLIDGFVNSADLPGGGGPERWRLNRQTGALVAIRSGKTVTIGDRFMARIVAVNPTARQLDLAVVGVKAKKKTTGTSETSGNSSPQADSAGGSASNTGKNGKNTPSPHSRSTRNPRNPRKSNPGKSRKTKPSKKSGKPQKPRKRRGR